MFAVGHVALGHMVGKLSDRALGVESYLPLIWTLSLLPDVDILIPRLAHRGPTHSILVTAVIFTPLLIWRVRRVIPYFLALVSHSLLGDYFTGPTQLLWPASTELLRYRDALTMGGVLEAYLEWALFTLLIMALTLSRDHSRLFNSDKRNMLLFIPLCTILLPVMYRYPTRLPRTLIMPHLILFGIILLSVIMPFYQKYLRSTRYQTINVEPPARSFQSSRVSIAR